MTLEQQKPVDSEVIYPTDQLYRDHKKGIYSSGDRSKKFENLLSPFEITQAVFIQSGHGSSAQCQDVDTTTLGPLILAGYDGVGGQINGRLAALAARNAIYEQHKPFKTTLPTKDQAMQTIIVGFEKAHQAIFNMFGGGTTAAVVLPCLEGGELSAVIGWQGDTQVLLTRNQKSRILTFDDNFIARHLPNDTDRLEWQHRYANCTSYQEYKEIMADTRTKIDQEVLKTDSTLAFIFELAETSPWESWNLIKKFVYGMGRIDGHTDTFPKPHILTIPLQNDDVLAVCTDGINDPNTLAQIEEAHNKSTSPSEITQRCMYRATNTPMPRKKYDDRLMSVMKIKMLANKLLHLPQ